ncbi:MAG TPA: hypothetical protein VL426_01890 [Candidatus Binatia bacterium]|jgi:hypothetical protein|nr:hypothetical protein [Candidatus Binatia bacterium]
MHKDEFQKSVLEEIKRELERGDVPLSKMRELAAAALDIGQKYPDEIPNEEAERLVEHFAEIARETAKEVNKESKREEDEGKIDEIRRSMGLR